MEDAPGLVGEITRERLAPLQKLIARRMVESKTTAPDFTLELPIDMAPCASIRERLRDEGRDTAPTYNDLVVAASARALREYPRANGSYVDGAFQLHERVNVGVAVAYESSLIVPTIFDADRRSLEDIAAESRRLVERVRARMITAEEMAGGTFTISNLGMFGISRFTAVINPPQAAILAVGAVERKPIVEDDRIVPGLRMALTLVCDHRILYGAPAARFLVRIRELLEAPEKLLDPPG